MIFDSLHNLSQYTGLSSHMDAAIHALLTMDLSALPLGRSDIAGDDVYVLIQSAVRKPAESLPYEAHRRYADIQIAFTPGETISVAPVGDGSAFSPYDDINDCMLSHAELASTVEIRMPPHYFAIFFPQDAHKPNIGEGVARKCVVKVRMP